MNDIIFIDSLFFILGLVFGSFGNVLIYRLPAGMPITGRSKCPNCSCAIAAQDLMPILSYVLLRGHCRQCHCTISPRYLIVELVSGGLFLLAFHHTQSITTGYILAMALWFLLLITIIDFQTQGIPDVLNFPFIGLGVLFGFISGHLNPLTFSICAGFFVLQWIVSYGRWVGSGDVLLSFGISGLLHSWELALVMLCTAYISGSIAAVFLLLNKKSSTQDRLAFAPFLAFGTVIALLAGDWILETFLYL